MLYKHFIAALAVAFLCFIGAISAQTEHNCMTTAQIFDHCKGNPKKVFELVAQKKLDYLDVQTFVSNSLLNHQYNDFAQKVIAAYWENLAPQERYYISNHRFLDKYPPLMQLKDGLLVLDERLEFIFKHKDKMIKYNSSTDLTKYLSGKLCGNYLETSKFIGARKLTTSSQKKAAFQPYFNQIATLAPECKDYVEAHYYTVFVYNIRTETKEYARWASIYLDMGHRLETFNDGAAHLYAATAKEIIYYSKDKELLLSALDMVNKAAKIETRFDYALTKAKIFALLGEKDKAKQTYNEACKTLKPIKIRDDDYHKEVKGIIDKL